jgi:hypothetical protein
MFAVSGVSCHLMIALSSNTERCIKALFAGKDRDRVSVHLLRECGDNLPLVEAPYHDLAERIRFPVLKLSNGDFGRLLLETGNAAIDWRDCLVAAGFGDDTEAHLAWKVTLDAGT